MTALEELDRKEWAGAQFDDDPLPDPLPFEPVEPHWLTVAMTRAGSAMERWALT